MNPRGRPRIACHFVGDQGPGGRWPDMADGSTGQGARVEARSMPFWFVFAVCLASTVTVAGRVTLSGTLEIAVRNALLGLRRPAAR